jgi:hypothetical protein
MTFTGGRPEECRETFLVLRMASVWRGYQNDTNVGNNHPDLKYLPPDRDLHGLGWQGLTTHGPSRSCENWGKKFVGGKIARAGVEDLEVRGVVLPFAACLVQAGVKSIFSLITWAFYSQQQNS